MNPTPPQPNSTSLTEAETLLQDMERAREEFIGKIDTRLSQLNQATEKERRDWDTTQADLEQEIDRGVADLSSIADQAFTPQRK